VVRVLPAEQIVLSGSMSFVALTLLCGAAVYVIFRLDDVPLLKWTISLATFCLLFSQWVNVLEDVPSLQSWALFSPQQSWHSEVKSYATLVGLILLLATLYLALLETVAAKAAVVRERNGLYVEIAERRSAQSALNESRDRLRRLSAHLESVREDERTRVAREIHDELGQALTSLKFDLANLRQQLARSDNERCCDDLINEMAGQIDGTVGVVRRLIAELRPGILDDLGLEAAVEWQARDFERRTGIPCAVSVETDGVEPDRDRSTALFCRRP
jgi:signal transduction histidine kinase